MNKDKKNTALFFINSLYGGGAETSVRTQIDYLVKNDWKIVLVLLSNKESFLFGPKVEVYNLDILNKQTYFKSFKLILNMKQIIKNNNAWNNFLDKYSNYKFSYICANLPLSHKLAMCSPFADSVIYVMQLSFSVVPKLFSSIHSWIIRRSYKNKKIAAVSDGIKDELIFDLHLNKSNVKTIYNPAPEIDKTDIKNAANNKEYFLVVGRFVKQKNISKAIEIFYEGKFYKKFNLYIFGHGPQKAKLYKQIKKYNLEKYVFIKNYDKNILRWIRSAKLLMCTSNQEGLPLSFLESLKLDTPVISYDCPTGPKEILTNELSEFLLERNCKNEIYIDKINKIISGEYPKIVLDNKFENSNVINLSLSFYSQ